MVYVCKPKQPFYEKPKPTTPCKHCGKCDIRYNFEQPTTGNRPTPADYDCRGCYYRNYQRWFRYATHLNEMEELCWKEHKISENKPRGADWYRLYHKKPVAKPRPAHTFFCPVADLPPPPKEWLRQRFKIKSVLPPPPAEWLA